jgi:tRNA (mo5U34)-methyltransferase
MPEADVRIEELDWYHTLELPNETTAGVYDHRKVEAFYGFPPTLAGKRVLDVGAGDGFFSFLFERLGAQEVVAVNPPRWDAEDYFPAKYAHWQRENLEQKTVDKLALASSLLASSVRQIKGNIYGLDPAEHGTFDLVFCGSLLCHLTDPLRALFALRSVCIGTCIIATPATLERPDWPGALFVGQAHSHTFWAFTPRCLNDMLLAAGFASAACIATFDLCSERGDPVVIPHVVSHASV